MANRSYLYAINFDNTTEDLQQKDRKIVGLSEYNYDIPLSYRILVSQDTALAYSIIWEYEKPIAIQGDFAKGKEKLFHFLDSLLTKSISEKDLLENEIKETKNFLNAHKSKYILLECGEIFEMDDVEVSIQNNELYKELHCEIEEDIKILEALQSNLDEINLNINKMSNSLLSKLFRKNNQLQIKNLKEEREKIKTEIWRMLGIDNWTTILFYDFSH